MLLIDDDDESRCGGKGKTFLLNLFVTDDVT